MLDSVGHISSSIIVGGSKHIGCQLCFVRKKPLYSSFIFKIIHCPVCVDYICLPDFHFDQELNLMAMVYRSEKIARQFFNDRYVLDYTNGEFPEDKHLYFHIRKRMLF